MKANLYKLACFFILTVVSSRSFSQGSVTLPPSGDNNRNVITQYIGSLVSVTITYNSPNVTGPNGEDRKGKIWGELVPYGFVDQGFGTSKAAPWRAGSNQNTTITFSHDVLVQGKPLKAGTYGFFISPQQNAPWMLIFSKNYTSWGSFFYNENEDALRVTTMPKDAPYHEWLSYEFIDREQDSAVCALYWESKMIPFTIKVPNMVDLYVANFRNELRNSPGFGWQAWNDAANYCYVNKTNLEEALTWSDKAISMTFVGGRNFTSLQTKSEILGALGRTEESKRVLDSAISDPTATALQVHFYARGLQANGKKDEAIRIYQMNAKLHPNEWPVNWGLARAYSAQGDYKNALKYARLALPQAPDEVNRTNIESGIKKLENKQDIN